MGHIARLLARFGLPHTDPGEQITFYMRENGNLKFTSPRSVLVQADANVNAQDSEGNTSAFSTYSPDTFRFLAGHGADLTIRNHAGQTATENPQRYAAEWASLYAEVLAVGAGK
ncbi:MAG: hypothetical protein ACRYFU_21580 [Janthinobacterium lividum]